jgi:hypothetical protein
VLTRRTSASASPNANASAGTRGHDAEHYRGPAADEVDRRVKSEHGDRVQSTVDSQEEDVAPAPQAERAPGLDRRLALSRQEQRARPPAEQIGIVRIGRDRLRPQRRGVAVPLDRLQVPRPQDQAKDVGAHRT